MKKFIIAFVLCCSIFLSSTQWIFSQKDLTISREFKLITSRNLSGYLKPLFTSISQSWHSDYYTRANYANTWSFGLDFSAMGMFIPSDQLKFSAELPDRYGNTNIVENAELLNGIVYRNHKGYIEEPTIYGTSARPVFAAPQNHFPPDSFYKTVTFVEGNNISFMSGIPIVQLNIGLPTRSQIRIRIIPIPNSDANITYLAFALNQNIDKFFDWFKDESMGIAVNLGYHSLTRDPGIDVTAFAAGFHFSKTWNWFSLYTGTQYENLSGTVKAVRTQDNLTDRINSPYAEIRNSEPLIADLSTFTNFRFTAGFSMKFGFFDMHTDFTYATQPMFNAGASFWLWEQEAELPFPDIYNPIPNLNQGPIFALKNTFGDFLVQSPQMQVIKKKELELNITAVGLDNNKEIPLPKILVEEFSSRQLRALLPFIFFDENSSTIPSKYKILTSESAKSFSKSDLLGQTSLENYYHVLNILGSRLNTYPNSKITITGCNSNLGLEKNNKKLSQTRAETIKMYLTSTWNIDPARMTIKIQNLPSQPSNSTDPDGAAENRRVEITSDAYEIIEPSMVQDTLRKVVPGTVRFKPEIVKGNDLKKWSVNASIGGKTMKSFSGDSIFVDNLDWQLENEGSVKAKLKNSIDYKVSGFDEDGKYVESATKNIPIEVITIKKKEEDLSKDTIINLYNLILFDFNKSSIGIANQKIVDFIKSELTSKAIIKVIGFTDRIGNADHNLKLSTERAKSTAKAINAPNTTILGKGEGELIFNNDSPEGRFYCRTVVVEVKIPKN